MVTQDSPATMTRVDWSFPTIAAMKGETRYSLFARVRTTGYYAYGDGGGADYRIESLSSYLDDFPDGPDNLIDHEIGDDKVAVLLHNRQFNAQQCGVRNGVESSTAWNNAFWRAASLAKDVGTDPQNPVRFICWIDVLTNKTLHASAEPDSEFEVGNSVEVETWNFGRIIAVEGGTFETHLNSEMTRLTTLHGSSVTLGSALNMKFLKADPQLAENLGDKIERPLPLVSLSLQRVNVYFGWLECDFWCSGIRIDGCTAISLESGINIWNFRKYGVLYTKRSNNAIKTWQVNAKQWSLSDTSSHDGRMMPNGAFEPQNRTGDPLAVCQKDMMWFGGTYGWGRTAITLLDKCGTDPSDRWAGRTMYPDYFTRWSDGVWDDHGGNINNAAYDRMAPATGTGDCDFYGVHVMQGFGDNPDEEANFRGDGLAFGGQTGIESWNSGNPVNFYGADIDSSITQDFGTALRVFGPTKTVGNTALHSCFHPIYRVYAARRTHARLSSLNDWTGSLGFFSFDRGTVGSPNVVTMDGDFEYWNYINRVDSGSHTGDVQYRGVITGGSGNLPSSSVVAAGDFFHVQQAGTYGGQAMAKGDILYALTTSPGTSYGANWHLGANQDVEALTQGRETKLRSAFHCMVPQSSDDPVHVFYKPDGDFGTQHYIGDAWTKEVFDGSKVTESGSAGAYKRRIEGDLEITEQLLSGVSDGAVQFVEISPGSDELRFNNSAGTDPANANTIILRKTGDVRYGQKVAVPASAGATGTVGQWAVDANYLYLCHATDTWKRVAITTW